MSYFYTYLGCTRTSALVVIKGDSAPPQFKFKVDNEWRDEVIPTQLKSFEGHYVWRLEWKVLQTEKEQEIDYSIDDGKLFRYVVPASDKPLRMAYGSCFGFSNLGYMKKVKEKDQMWYVLRDKHGVKPYHLMLMGGDQVYADMMWETVPLLKAWFDNPIEIRVRNQSKEFRDLMSAHVGKFYFDLYCNQLKHKAPASVMSRIPSLMMWDDHDKLASKTKQVFRTNAF
jgi:hypothetical protein